METNPLDYTEAAREAGNELLRCQQDHVAQTQQSIVPQQNFLLTSDQRDALLLIITLAHTPGIDTSPAVQELIDLPELEDYCILEPTTSSVPPETDESCRQMTTT